ncbi:hypothetical protein Taro_010794 [Colocasia esculenta]|uniref:BED-type domain-containing protein n=1 Tax=Colocasia esculenta TaxID=4460 RepID=A0A843UAM9_COLES|nr:hypothetical protein [Colocasia esculenta]
MARGEQRRGLDNTGWAHLTLVDAIKRKVKCNYCGKDIHGGITRGKQHLAGVRGEVKQCDIAPREMREEMRQCLLGQRGGRQRRAENEAKISRELSGGMSRRATRDDDDEPGSEDSNPELTEAVESEWWIMVQNRDLSNNVLDVIAIQVREDINDLNFDPTNTTWAEGILDGDEPRDPEFKVPAKRQRESSSKGKQLEIVEDTKEQFEPTRYSESDNRSVTPRMVKPPPSLRRIVSEIYI